MSKLSHLIKKARLRICRRNSDSDLSEKLFRALFVEVTDETAARAIRIANKKKSVNIETVLNVPNIVADRSMANPTAALIFRPHTAIEQFLKGAEEAIRPIAAHCAKNGIKLSWDVEPWRWNCVFNSQAYSVHVTFSTIGGAAPT